MVKSSVPPTAASFTYFEIPSPAILSIIHVLHDTDINIYQLIYSSDTKTVTVSAHIVARPTLSLSFSPYRRHVLRSSSVRPVQLTTHRNQVLRLKTGAELPLSSRFVACRGTSSPLFYELQNIKHKSALNASNIEFARIQARSAVWRRP